MKIIKLAINKSQNVLSIINYTENYYIYKTLF